MSINLVLKYIFVFVLNTGVTGAALSTLIAMVCDWVVRAVIFEYRFKKEKWTNNHVI